jgi:hypothetical protein
MMQHSRVPETLWGEACAYSAYFTNYSLSSTIDGQTPYFELTQQRPDVSQFRVFGCKAETLIQNHHLTKFSSRTKEVIHIGISQDGLGYRVWDPSTKRISVTRNVTFFENKFISSVSHPNARSISLPMPYVDSNSDSDEEFLLLNRGGPAPIAPVIASVNTPIIEPEIPMNEPQLPLNQEAEQELNPPSPQSKNAESPAVSSSFSSVSSLPSCKY